MKKSLSVMLLVILLLGLAVPTYAATTCDISDIGLSVTFPDGWLVFTKDTPENDPGYAVINSDKATLDSMLDLSGYKAYAYNPSDKSDFTLSFNTEDETSKTRVFDLKQYDALIKQTRPNAKSKSDLLIAALKKETIQTISGMTCSAYDKYSDDQADYLVLTGTANINGMDSKTVEYDTYVNGTQFSFGLHDYSGNDVTANQAATLKTIVDSATFSGVQPLPDDVVHNYQKKIYSDMFYFSFEGLLYALLLSLPLYLLVLAFLKVTKLVMSVGAGVFIAFLDCAAMFVGLPLLQNAVSLKISLTLWYALLWLVFTYFFIRLVLKIYDKAASKAYQEALDKFNAQKQKAVQN